jgi:pimeloyl-[acyl-carrier protein] synthase
MTTETSSTPGCPVSFKGLVEGYTDPHGLYDTLRARDSVTFDAAGRCWVVTGHAAVRSILSDERFVSDPSRVAPPARRPARRSFVGDAIQKQIIFVDGPKQARVQRAVLVELARRADDLAEPLRRSAAALAERARDRGGLDLLADFATPFSMRAISLILGLPEPEPELGERLERWSTTYADMTSGYLRMEVDDVVDLGAYFRAQVAARGGGASDDLVGAFLRDAGLDDEEEVVIQCMMAFAAGRVTTQKLLGNGIPLLLPAWDAWRRMVEAHPASVRRLTDELLRVVTPTRYVVRFAAEDVALGENGNGPAISRGDRVALFLEAANRDPGSFCDPHALQGDRQPNPHVAFGFGAHRCPGASIARIEIQTALLALLQTIPALHPHPTIAPTWDPNPNLGGYASYSCVCRALAS